MCKAFKFHSSKSSGTIMFLFDKLQVIEDALWAFLYLCEYRNNMYWEEVPTIITFCLMEVIVNKDGVETDSQLMVRSKSMISAMLS